MFKVGDKVICKPGFEANNSSAGHGYKEGLILTIDSFTEYGDQKIAWQENKMLCGIFTHALELYKEKEEQQTINNNYSIF